jgi:glutathione S-transferase
MQPEPSLFPEGSEGLARMLAQWLDTSLFWSTMAYSFQPAGLAAIFEGSPPGMAKAFGEDRAKMRAGAARLPTATGFVQFRNALAWLEQRLAQQGKGFLLGGRPCLADFSAYHSMWFVKHQARITDAFDAAPAVAVWMERMAALGHGAPEPARMASAEAIELAARSTPQAIAPAPLVDAHKLELGQRVSVTPIDYGFDPVEGELLQATAQRVSIRRESPRAGVLNVHFPRIGFEIRGVET